MGLNMSGALRKTTIEIDWKINNNVLQTANEETDKVIQKAGQAEQRFKGTGQSIDGATSSLKKNNSELGSAAKNVDELAGKYGQTEKESGKFGNTTKKASDSAKEGARDTLREVEKVGQGYNEAREESGRFGSTTQKANDTARNSAKDTVKEIEKVSTEYEQSGKDSTKFGDSAKKANEKVQKSSETTAKETEKIGDEYNQAKQESAKFKDTATEANKKVEKSASDLNKDLDQTSAKFVDMNEKAGKLGQTLTVGVTLPIMAGGVAAFNYASDTNESLNKVEVAFGKNADSVKQWSKTTLDNIGLAQGTALDLAATYGDMGTSMGLTTAEAGKMSTNMVDLAGDLASFKNIGIDQANSALTGVFTGETEALTFSAVA